MNAKMISPTGKLIGVSQAVPVVEKVFKFNGRVQRMSERAGVFKGVKPNAISIKTENCANFMFQNELIIGNLKTERVNTIMRSLLEKGYYDFSEMHFQTARTEEELVFDNGASLPYSSDITIMMNQNFCCHDNFGSPINRPNCSNKDQLENDDFFDCDTDDFDFDGFDVFDDEEGDEESYDEFGGESYE